jgi:hypothetical protein
MCRAHQVGRRGLEVLWADRRSGATLRVIMKRKYGRTTVAATGLTAWCERPEPLLYTDERLGIACSQAAG